MLPQIAELEFEEVLEEQDEPRIGKSFLFDFDTGEFVFNDGKMVPIYGKDVLKQWIHKTILTAKGRFRVYIDSPEYGVRIDDLVGSIYPLDFIKKEVENELTEALMQNEQIIALRDFDAEMEESKLTVRFTVDSTFEEFEQEVIV